MKTLFWKQDNQNGKVFAPKYEGDAGYDLSVSQQCFLQPNTLAQVPCGVSIALPEGYAALVIARSSSVVKGLFVYPTLIDTGYRGPMFVMVRNQNDYEVMLASGQRVAQLLLIPVPQVSLEQVMVLPDSQRGHRGFGSTGG